MTMGWTVRYIKARSIHIDKENADMFVKIITERSTKQSINMQLVITQKQILNEDKAAKLRESGAILWWDDQERDY